MSPRERRLRERIDRLLDEREHYRELAASRLTRMDYYSSRCRYLARSREYWKRTAGARIRKRLAA